MRPLLAALAFLALVAGVVAVGLYLLRETPPGPEVIDEALGLRDATAPKTGPRQELPRGGVYAGIVTDTAGKAVRGAGILLVAFDTGEEALKRQALAGPDEFDPANLAVVGFRTGAEGKTDASGRFRIAADRTSAIRAVFAWREGFSPTIVAVEGPREGIEIVLDPAGEFIGHVVDDATGEPVAHADVAIYLQSKAVRAPERIGERSRGGRLEEDVSVFARAQRWVARELGPRVWGSEWRGDETIRTHTDRHGTFRFGPINDAVQLEFVITHARYKWTEFDQTESGRIARTVVPPGETVERTFRLVPGKSLAGRVIDTKTGKGVPDVVVKIEHVAQYTQHHWYRIKKRITRTARDGSFKVGGLSFGPYTAVLEHPTFGQEHIPQIPEDSKNLQWYVASLGALVGRVEGLADKAFGTRVRLTLEAVGDVPDQPRHQKYRVRLDPSATFAARGIKPGTYLTWVQVGNKSSEPQQVEVKSLESAPISFVLRDGGTLLLRVWDAAGQPVDPGILTLVRVAGEDGSTRQALGRFVTREGRLSAQGVAPGRYLGAVSSPGYLPQDTEVFTVTDGGTVDLGEVTLRQYATLQVGAIVGADGGAPGGPVRISVREGDGEFRPLPMLTQSEVPVEPGRVTVRAVCEDGTSFQRDYEALDGQTFEVRVVLSR